jgi:hypothetical protein
VHTDSVRADGGRTLPENLQTALEAQAMHHATKKLQINHEKIRNEQLPQASHLSTHARTTNCRDGIDLRSSLAMLVCKHLPQRKVGQAT